MTFYPDHQPSEQEHEVTPLELFFDLVFVFAVSQLSHHLLSHLSWRGAGETLTMLLTVLTVWSFTSWAATMVRADRLRTLWMMLAVMLFGLFMNASITRAFTTAPWAFLAPLLIIQFGRTLWTIASAPDPVNRDQYVRVLVWFVATAPLWIAGALVTSEARLGWWALAAGIEFIGTLLAHPIPGRKLRSEDVAFDADHMLERCRLFLLIALGETLLTSGAAIAGVDLTPMAVLTGTSAMVGTVALWSMIFGGTHRTVAEHLEETHDPIRASRFAVYVMMATVAGLVGVAVANEVVIAHPHAATSPGLALMIGGGPIVLLAAQAWYLSAVVGAGPRRQLLSCAALVVVSLATLAVPAYAALILMSATLTLLAVLDQRSVQVKPR